MTAASAEESIGLLLPVNTSGWAIAAGYLGLFSVLLVFAPFSLAAGLFALRDLKRHPKRRGRVRAWLGTIMGAIFTLALLLLVLSALRS